MSGFFNQLMNSGVLAGITAAFSALASIGIISAVLIYCLERRDKRADLLARRRLLLNALKSQLDRMSPEEVDEEVGGVDWFIPPYPITAVPLLLDGNTLDPIEHRDLIDALIDLEGFWQLQSEIDRAVVIGLFTGQKPGIPNREAQVLIRNAHQGILHARRQIRECLSAPGLSALIEADELHQRSCARARPVR